MTHAGEDELDWIAACAGATAVSRREHVQTLWGGYGALFRVQLEGGARPTAIVKRVDPPLGAGASRSDERKRRSYEVESTFYRRYAARCGATCRVAELLGSARRGEGWLLVLEDLEPARIEPRTRWRGDRGPLVERCLAWLAAFHATFLGVEPEGLWAVGTYWHLATRPEELAAIEDVALREAAPVLDGRLDAARYKTLVHGDAKEANYCLASSPLAAVDFQYVGGGVGVKDVAYLLHGNVHSAGDEARFLDLYFTLLRGELEARGVDDAAAVEAEWRALYRVAEADFLRFLAGWGAGPGRHAATRLFRDALRRL
ncbi:MAG: phosphotransferase [Polyangiaceae bacterium]